MGEDFEDLGEEVLDGFGLFKEGEEALIEEKEEVARFDGE